MANPDIINCTGGFNEASFHHPENSISTEVVVDGVSYHVDASVQDSEIGRIALDDYSEEPSERLCELSRLPKHMHQARSAISDLMDDLGLPKDLIEMNTADVVVKVACIGCRRNLCVSHSST